MAETDNGRMVMRFPLRRTADRRPEPDISWGRSTVVAERDMDGRRFWRTVKGVGLQQSTRRPEWRSHVL
jgi:hypothetical protein